MNRGFTLIEILVALVILSIALTSISYMVSTNSHNAAYIDEKTTAHWVAMNVISQYQLAAQQDNFNDQASSEGDVQMLNKTWYWSAEINPALVPKMYIVKVDVRANPKREPLEHLESYIYSGVTADE